MRYVARVFWMGMSSAGSVDYLELSRWALTKIYLLIGAFFILIGLVLLPLPIPLGLPLIALGLMILLNTSTTAKRVFLRWGRRHPRTVGRVRTWMRERHRARRDRDSDAD